MKKIFIGSSGTAQKKAKLLKRLLAELGADVICWFELYTFLLGKTTIDSLLEQTRKCHGAIFIFDKDDEIKSNGPPQFVPRDNVIYEAGLFAGALGKEAVAICLVPGAHQITDLDGVTYLNYDPEDDETMKERLRLWLINNVRDDRPPKSQNNLLMKPRKNIHQLYTIENRLHFKDDGYKYIRRIRLMNLASNLVLNPEFIDMGQIQQSPSELSNAVQRILQESHAVLELILPEPHPANLRDAVTKIANLVAGSPENLIYMAWRAIYDNVFTDATYSKAHKEHRFLYFSLKIGIPYAVFGVEFDGEYEKYDHVKIDLYSCELGNESQRRSFVIWKNLDYENYHFFIENFDSVKRNKQICYQPELPIIKGWLDEWDTQKGSKN